MKEDTEFEPYEERVVVDSIPLEQRRGMHDSPLLFCIVAQLKDPHLMIAGSEEECKELVVAEGGEACWC